MKSVDIKKIENIKEDIDSLDKGEVLFINEDGSEKYVLMPIELYDTIEESLSVFDENAEILNDPKVKIINANNFELTYDEYENVKKQILDAFDKTFKPKPEKLN